MTWCCVHVCAVIYVLSIIKNDLNFNPGNIKYPASHLNDILVNTEKSEKCNQPRYVKHIRRIIKKVDQISESSSDESTLSGIADFETSVLSSVELLSENEESNSSTFLSTIE